MIDKPDNGTVAALDAESLSMLQSIFGCSGNDDGGSAMEEGFSRTASVKFMITLQDEDDLRSLGYSQLQINKIKPEAAREIIQAGTRALQD